MIPLHKLHSEFVSYTRLIDTNTDSTNIYHDDLRFGQYILNYYFTPDEQSEELNDIYGLKDNHLAYCKLIAVCYKSYGN